MPPSAGGMTGAAIAASGAMVAIDNLDCREPGRLCAVGGLASASRFLFTLATLLFFVLPPSVLHLIGWHYLGGGTEFEKVHLATYLLIGAFICLWLADPHFRGKVSQLICTDWTLISFTLAVGAVASYAILVKHVSIAPFVDTFLVAILATIGWVCLSTTALGQLRRLLDIYFIANIAVLFLEYATRSWMFAPLIFDYPQFRSVGLFENPLTAANLLGVYCISSFVSMPVRFTRASATRLVLGFISLFAILTTGGRAALVATISILIVFLLFAVVRQLAAGRVNRAAITYGIFAVPLLAVCVATMQQLGLFNTMVSRFAYDIGSASSRQVAVDLASTMPMNDLWQGLSRGDVVALAQRQSEFNLIAIEISWLNFILTCGLALTAVLFATYFLFLVRFLPRYCGAQAVLPAIFLLVVTAASNGIWAKTTLLTTSFALILAVLRYSRSMDLQSRAPAACP